MDTAPSPSPSRRVAIVAHALARGASGLLPTAVRIKPQDDRCPDRPWEDQWTVPAEIRRLGIHGGRVEALRHNLRIAAVLVLLGSLGTPPLEGKRKDDVVVMKNGDKFTGEIKKLENGILYFKAEYMVDPVELDWERVDHLESSDAFRVFLLDGKRVIGHITERENQGLAVQSGGAEIPAQPREVVSLVPVEDTFLKQLAGSVDGGFSFTGGANALQATLSFNVSYFSEAWRSRLTGNSVFNRQSGASDSGRNTLEFQYLKQVSGHWLAGSTASYLTSDQQDLAFRSIVGGAVGREFVHSGTAGLLVLAGVGFSREKYSLPGLSDTNGAEALFQIQFSRSAFRTLQLEGDLAANPVLTMPGRVRLSAQSSLKREIARNLFLRISFYENYDSAPPSKAPKNDLGAATSLGWTF